MGSQRDIGKLVTRFSGENAKKKPAKFCTSLMTLSLGNMFLLSKPQRYNKKGCYKTKVVKSVFGSTYQFLLLGSLRIDDFCTTTPLDCVTCLLRIPFWALTGVEPKSTTLVRAICRRLRNSWT